jgi:hypothetical protein
MFLTLSARLLTCLIFRLSDRPPVRPRPVLPSNRPSVNLSICTSINPFRPSIWFVCPSVRQSGLSVRPSIRQSVRQSASPSVRLSVCPSVTAKPNSLIIDSLRSPSSVLTNTHKSMKNTIRRLSYQWTLLVICDQNDFTLAKMPNESIGYIILINTTYSRFCSESTLIVLWIGKGLHILWIQLSMRTRRIFP